MTEREREEMSKGPDDLQRAFEEGWEISEDDFEETQELTEAPVRKNGSAQKNESAQKNGNVHRNAAAQKSVGTGSDIHKRQSSGKRRPETGRSKGPSGSAGRTRAAAGQKRGKKRRRKGKGFSAMDGVIGLTGAAVCLFAVFTFSFVMSARAQERQVASFAAVGEELSQISVADESTFLAVADGLLARQQAAEYVETEYEETEEASEVQVGLNMTSVEKDLKIKFVNRKTGKLIPYVAFEVKVTGPDQTYQKTDDDEDGIIYLTGKIGRAHV